MRIIGTILSGFCLFAWVAYLSWPVSVDAYPIPRQPVVETARPTVEPAPTADAMATSDVAVPAV
jgi:hypothetical protein